jgi:hypothetical protein
MSLEFRFDIEELPDAESFILYDLTENWGGVNAEKADVIAFKITFTALVDLVTHGTALITLPLTTSEYPVVNWEAGLAIPFGDSETILPDGSYEVTITLYDVNENAIASTTKNMAFYAIIKDSTMNYLLGYSPFLPKRTKEMYLEKGRILDNLYYAAQTDQILHFDENLENLQNLR